MKLSEDVEILSVEPHRKEGSPLSRVRTILLVFVDFGPSLTRRVEKLEERREPFLMRVRDATKVVGELGSKPAFHVGGESCLLVMVCRRASISFPSSFMWK